MSLAYTEDPVDTAVIALLKSQGLSVHVGSVSDADDNTKTISAPMPYVLYLPALDYVTSPRMGGWGARSKDFAVHFAATSSRGAENYGRAVRDYLRNATVTVTGKPRRIRMWNPDERLWVSDDPTWNRPDGGAIYFGRMEFYVTK